MALRLFEHNEKAYKSAIQMMEQYGKAAIVHPTGTGKSYIAFKLIEDNPEKVVIWLSPSEYIFKTQLESLKRNDPDFPLANVHFYTYAKLMCCTQAQLDEIIAQKPAYIILDEFHRAGAECWGESTVALLKLCPDAKLLGLTATNIRYLDNNRDMAEELFDSRVASDMTLGEAVVRGILPAPKYVTTVYQYQKALVKYQARVDNLRAPGIQDAHPHVSGNCSRSGSGAVESEVVGVHNGIIENYTELKEKLLKHGYMFYSQTDTEVVIKLVDYYYKKYNLGPIDAIAKTMVRVRGSYALELMFRDYPGEIWVARKDSPMIIGIADGETYVASDVPAILKYTRNVYYIGNLEFAKLTPGEAHFYDLNGDEIEKQTTEIKWDAEAAEKGGFEHFMMKEINEQPKAVQDTLNSVIKDGAIDLSGVEITEEEIKNFEQIYIFACGSA